MKQYQNLVEQLTIKVGARSSKLSQIQVLEVYNALIQYTPSIQFESILIKTYGDKHLEIPLTEVQDDDFFTRELDTLLLKGTVDIAIHSAKDLPKSLKNGLSIAAITKGVDNRDVLVLREHDRLETLPLSPVIGTSSFRREAMVKKMFHSPIIKPIRGTIEARLNQLYEGHYDAIIMAEAALIRLKLEHINRIYLTDDPEPLQGRLAIVCRSNDHTMHSLFKPLHFSS